MAKSGSSIEVLISANTKQYDAETKRLVKDAKNLQKSLELKFDGKTYAEAQRMMKEAIERTDSKAISLKNKLRELETAGKVDTTEYQNLNSQLIKTQAEATQLNQKLKEINQIRIDNLVNGFKNVGDSITKAGQALMPFSAAAAGLIASFGAIGFSAVKAGDYIGTTSKQLNISSTALQKWLYIAEQTDVEATQFVNAVTKMQGALAHLAAGESDITASALKELGFTAEQAALGMESNFEKIIESLANVEDATMQAYYANEIFGTRMGSKIIPLLNNGGDGLKELGAQFEALGYLSEDTVNDLDNFEDVMDRIKYQFTLVKNEIGASFLPLMQAMADTIETRVIPVFQRLRDFFQSLSLNQQKLIVGILTFTAALAPVLLIIGKLTSGVGSMIGMVAKLAASFGSMGLALGPIAAIAALFAILYSSNENFRKSINSLVSTLGSALMPILSVIGNLFETVLKAIMPLVDILGDVLATQIQFLVTAITPFIQVLTNVLVPVLNVVLGVLQTVLGFILGPLSKGFKFMSDLYMSIFKGIETFIKKIMDFVGIAVNKAIDWINVIIRNINKIGEKLGFTISEIENVKIQLETGKLPDEKSGINNQSNLPVNQAINQSTTSHITNNNITSSTDYSTKNVNIEVTVQNYAEYVDVDDMVRQINLKLAEQM